MALSNSDADLSCNTPTACAADAAVVDLDGYGSAAIYEGSNPAPGTDNTTSSQRTDPSTDTDDNSADFTSAAPTPEDAGTAGTGGGGGQPGDVAIHDIQGDSFVSPMDGDSVSNVPGIVTAVRTSSSKGFWMQDPHPDDDAATSEGIFVYTSSAPSVSVGDSVLVSGTVDDYYQFSSGDSLSTTQSLSTTEITSPTVSVASSGNDLPAAQVVTPRTVPHTYAPDLGGGNIENTPLTPGRSALDFWESKEGMRIEVDDARVVGPSNSYGEQYITTKPHQDRTYRGGTELLGDNQIPSGRLEIVPLDGRKLGANVGAVLSGKNVGVIDWSQYGGYTLEATTLGTLTHNDLAPVVATSGPRKFVSIATYNVKNLAPGNSDSKYSALASGVVSNLAGPDIVALEEIQDNDGATDDGVVAADRTLTQLVDAIVAAGGPHYEFRQVSPVNDQDGGQPGGNIRNAFLFNPKRVSFVDRGSSGVDRATVGTHPTKAGGQVALTLSPGRIDPTNPVWQDSRKPVVGQFKRGNQTFFVVANHFDSKGGDQNADGRFQYPQQSSRVQRAGQALAVHNFVQQLRTIQHSAEVVVLGDLNDYQFSPPLALLKTGTADGSGRKILSDLINTLPADQRYTYVYNGISQVLDHILVTPSIRRYSYQVVHVNSEYADQVSDHDPQVIDFRA